MDRRAQKRGLGLTASAYRAYQAYLEGQVAGEVYVPARLRTNPYPPGRRHDEWERGSRTGWDREKYWSC